ncbi:TolC family protein [Thalassomonas actiniarum]|uniref:TolC family protein n=1 Tax=Thalassomonas actiniarum TaxID=485447 RepID=A0AAE9YSC3_9GAMM|nr:TolC family protein [Thalassomonas actiniarum]WDD98612.1 TolC family protein [Thalassomonas actiniarum]
MKQPTYFISIISLCLLSACSTFDDVAFDDKASTQLQALAKTSFEQANQTAAIPLTELLAIGEVNHLITTALANNPGLQQTWLTLKTAEQQLKVTSTAQWPDISAQLNATKTEANSANYNPGLSVAWTVDIWQQLANATSAGEANLAASGYAYQGARDLLAANIMQSYLTLVQYAQLIDIEKRKVSTLKTNESVIVDRYRKGLIDLKDLDTAKSSTQSSQATLVEYQEQYQQALRNLALLTGVTKNQLIYRSEFPQVVMPLDKIQSQNLARRPDLQQAYQGIIADQYRHKVAYKALLPDLSLSASLSSTNTNLHDALFGSNAWQLLGQLTAPVFNAGKLKSEVEIARLSAEKSYWAFQETLLSAVNEVDNAIAQEQAISKRLVLTESALQSARRSEITYTERYRQGTVSLIDLLQVQQQTFSLQTQVTQLTYQKLNNRITLGLALGLGV